MTKSSFAREMYKKKKEENRREWVSKNAMRFRDFLSGQIDGLSVMISLLDEDLKLSKSEKSQFTIFSMPEYTAPSINSMGYAISFGNYKPPYQIKLKRNKRHMYFLEVDFPLSETTKQMIGNEMSQIATIHLQYPIQSQGLYGQLLSRSDRATITFKNFDIAMYTNSFSKVMAALINDLIEHKNK
jgi:hypothetical protein